ncbi:CDP-archaeol synthase [Methylocystis sp. IM3]|jgi:CDP-2,3-bis-(O-geranylgeranyl)-sn-glycerol synthase|uniref:CDP-archaeol synthase n=1 Tax=unclassified Methylocystis TaxID=2625913 RepID=UPI0030F584AB
MRLDIIWQVLLLLVIANGAPILATRVMGRRLAWPVDGGALFRDGKPLFGRSKTVRGLAASFTATAMGAHLLGLPWASGAAIAALAMAGDLFSSFLKRRLALASSARAVGLDQLPEALLPAFYAATAMSLTAAEAAAVVGLFFIGVLFLSRILYVLGIRERPY